jgi:hypothetical protein
MNQEYMDRFPSNLETATVFLESVLLVFCFPLAVLLHLFNFWPYGETALPSMPLTS